MKEEKKSRSGPAKRPQERKPQQKKKPSARREGRKPEELQDLLYQAGGRRPPMQEQRVVLTKKSEQPSAKPSGRKRTYGETGRDRLAESGTVRENRKSAKRAAKQKRIRNKEFTRITYVFVTLFLVMMGYVVYFNAVEGKEIIKSPYNKRQNAFAERVIRGKILDKDGNILAETKVAADGTQTRSYPYGSVYAHVVGYNSFGRSGLELSENFDLQTSNAFVLERIMNEFKDEKNIGDNVVTTLDTKLQQTAYNALGDSKGAVFVMEASTGKVLAMVSKSSFDPNTIDSTWETLNADGVNSPLLNRAMQGQYAPGSTFKIVTALEYMREHPDYNSYSYQCNGAIEHQGAVIHCFNGNVHGLQNLEDSFANSCNASFCNIGLSLDRDAYRKTAEELLFNKSLPRLFPYSKGQFTVNRETTDAELMMTAMGQGETLVSPYHMALITAVVANGGTVMKPYLVDEVVNHTGTRVKKNMPEKYKTLMSSEESAELKRLMTGVVEHGTGTLLSGQSYTAAGKTGTAEYSSDKSKSHSWFVGFSNVENPEVIVSVVVEGADDSGVKAVPIAKAIYDAYYR